MKNRFFILEFCAFTPYGTAQIRWGNCVFGNINLTKAEITNANLSGMTISDCNIDGLTVHGRRIDKLLEGK